MSTNPSFTHHHKLDLNSVRILVFSVNQHFDRFLLDSEARKCIQLSCHSMLKAPKQEFFEFGEHSILSNLFWGVEKLEAAVLEQSEEQRSSLLRSSEQMLQVPALLDEDGTTGGVSNQFLVCCSYFYLSIIRKLQNDEWQMASHVLQAILVSPRLVRTHFAPEIWEFLFLSHIIVENQEEKLAQLCEDAIDDVTRTLARRYKDWMMYYQVVLNKETSGFLWLPKHGVATDFCYQDKLCNDMSVFCSAGCVLCMCMIKFVSFLTDLSEQVQEVYEC